MTRLRVFILMAAVVLQNGWLSIATAEELPASVLACRAEKDDERRLNCFDREVARFSPQSASNPSATAASPVARVPSPASTIAPAPATAPETAPSAEASFGFRSGSAPVENERQRNKASTLKQLQATVSRVSQRGYGELVITLGNGQVWLQLAADSDFDLKAEDKVTITRAALGSYLMTNPVGRSTRVRRLR